jgi:hypothetical protein
LQQMILNLAINVHVRILRFSLATILHLSVVKFDEQNVKLQ